MCRSSPRHKEHENATMSHNTLLRGASGSRIQLEIFGGGARWKALLSRRAFRKRIYGETLTMIAPVQFIKDLSCAATPLSRELSRIGDTCGEAAEPRILKITVTGVFTVVGESGFGSEESVP
jgi:hypothetical protein